MVVVHKLIDLHSEPRCVVGQEYSLQHEHQWAGLKCCHSQLLGTHSLVATPQIFMATY